MGNASSHGVGHGLDQLWGLRIARYRLTLEAVDSLQLPAYKGSTLRGGFGGAFRRIACVQPGHPCHSCLLCGTCPYSYIFETPPPPGSEKLRRYQSVPRPFVLEPPRDRATEYPPGARLDFGLLLFGRAIAFFSYFVVVFRELGEQGLGRGRGRFRLLEIVAETPGGDAPYVVYDGATGTVRGGAAGFGGGDVMARLRARPSAAPSGRTQPGGRQFRVAFETMTRLTFDGHLQDRPEFHVLLRNLLRRLSSLAYFHHGFELDLDYAGLIARAAAVGLLADRTRWVDWERYSSRQEERMRLGGIVGEAVYEVPEDLEEVLEREFLPLLVLGEFTHVGKNVTFGLGKIRVLPGAIQTADTFHA